MYICIYIFQGAMFLKTGVYIYILIIQQIVTMPIYGKEALNICHPT